MRIAYSYAVNNVYEQTVVFIFSLWENLFQSLFPKFDRFLYSMYGLFCCLIDYVPIAVAERSKAWTAFAWSNTGVLGSNSVTGMEVRVCLFSLCVVLYVGSDLAMGWSPVQWALSMSIDRKNEQRPRSNKGCRTIIELITQCIHVEVSLCKIKSGIEKIRLWLEEFLGTISSDPFIFVRNSSWG
jgi:hypothetical protein